jgi:excisionase family DNA binding protein
MTHEMHATKTQTLGRLASAVAAARELGIPYTTLRELALRGEIPVVRLGRAWYFERRDLDRLVEQSKERVGA